MPDIYPYELIEQSDKHFLYQFTSEKRGDYVVRFSKATYYFNTVCTSCESIYEVSFFPVENIRGFDFRIKDTLFFIMEKFMYENQCPLLYVCESIDGLELCRLALFEKWSRALQQSGKRFQHDYRHLEWLDSEILLGIIAFPWDVNFELYFREIGTD